MSSTPMVRSNLSFFMALLTDLRRNRFRERNKEQETKQGTQGEEEEE